MHVPSRFHLDAAAERAVYALHDNSPEDQGYRRFLSRGLDPVLARVAPGSPGLDFGSGPGPTLSVMAQEAGHPCAIYDPFFAPAQQVLVPGAYAFVTATEVVEHVARPDRVFAQLFSLLKPGGVLGVMTKRTTTPEAFARWHYITDPTHVAFYGEATLQWLAERFDATVFFPHADVAVFVGP